MFDNYRHRQKQRQQEAARALGDVERYSSGSSSMTASARAVWQRLQRILDPRLRRLIDPMLGHNPTREQVQAVAQALHILRPDLFPESVGMPAPQQMLSGEVPEPSDARPGWLPQRRQQAEEDAGQRRQDRRYVYGVDPDDPVYRGQMIKVTSSNVHSIGYQWNDASPAQGTLLVRFWQKLPGQSKVPGPSYKYEHVHPNVFEMFRRAGSKGKFVWDRLRVRGTVSGHQYDYSLTGITQGYVPRQATRRGDQEWYIPRRVNVSQRSSHGPFREIVQMRSQHGPQMVQTLPGGRRIPLVQR